MKKEKKKIKHREELTFKQRNFIFWIAKGETGTAAAIKAGYKKDFAVKTASQLMTKPLVKAELDKYRQIAQKVIVATLEEKEKRLWEIANGDNEDAAIKAIDVMLKIRGEYASTKIEVDSRNVNINANIEIGDVQEIRKKFEREI